MFFEQTAGTQALVQQTWSHLLCALTTYVGRIAKPNNEAAEDDAQTCHELDLFPNPACHAPLGAPTNLRDRGHGRVAVHLLEVGDSVGVEDVVVVVPTRVGIRVQR